MSKILIDEATVKLALEALQWCHGGEPCGTADAITALQEALAKQPAQQEPPWWPAVENILNEYGLQAIDFVADFKAAQRKPLTDEEIDNIWRFGFERLAELVRADERARVTNVLLEMHDKATPPHPYYKHAALEINRK